MTLPICPPDFFVFPISPGEKVPLSGFNWPALSSNDPVQIAQWAQQYSNCNWAVDLTKSGYTVFDIDTYKPDAVSSLNMIEAFYGVLSRDTLQARSARGGLHIYSKGTLPGSINGILPGIDIKSTGGYVLLPGSTFEGKPYTWINNAPAAPLPAWAHKFFYDHKTDRAKDPERDKPACELDTDNNLLQAMDYLINRAPVAVENQGGNSTTYLVACAVRDYGLSADLAKHLLYQFWNPTKANPPWDQTELNRIVDHAYKYALGRAGAASLDAFFEPIAPISSIYAKPISEIKITEIPARQWLLGHRYIKGFITVTIAPGGVGKSTITMLEGLAVASGRQLTGEPVHRPGPVWIYNTEDPQDELERRIAAAAIHHKIDLQTTPLYITSGQKSPLVLVKADRQRGFLINEQAKAEMIHFIKTQGIALLIADPFIRTHQVEENDNTGIDKVVQVFSQIAAETGCAISIVHHTRKRNGKGGEGDMDTARGASSLVSAARIAHTINPMDPKTADQYGIPVSDRFWYLRLDDAKANMAPPSDGLQWFRKISVTLPSGDKIGTVEPQAFLMPPVDSGRQEIIDAVREVLGNQALMSITDAGRKCIERFPQVFEGKFNARGLTNQIKQTFEYPVELSAGGRCVVVREIKIKGKNNNFWIGDA